MSSQDQIIEHAERVRKKMDEHYAPAQLSAPVSRASVHQLVAGIVAALDLRLDEVRAELGVAPKSMEKPRVRVTAVGRQR